VGCAFAFALLLVSSAFAQPSAGWSVNDPPTLVATADFDPLVAGLEALHWTAGGDPMAFTDLLCTSLGDFQSLPPIEAGFRPGITTIFVMDLDEDGNAEAVLFERDVIQGDQTRVGSYSATSTSWNEQWFSSGGFSQEVNDLQLVDFNGTRRGQWVLATGFALELHDPATGAMVWDSQNNSQGPGRSWQLGTWTMADYNGDLAEELLVEFVDTHTGQRALWMIGESAVATSSGPFRSTLVSLGRSRPNPMFGETTIQFELPQSAPVQLRIVDARGRHVKTVAQKVMSAGAHDIRWDGRDDGGSRVAQGVYFYELSTANTRQSRKMIVLR
jgi:hypothetical protein